MPLNHRGTSQGARQLAPCPRTSRSNPRHPRIVVDIRQQKAHNWFVSKKKQKTEDKFTRIPADNHKWATGESERVRLPLRTIIRAAIVTFMEVEPGKRERVALEARK